MAKNEKNTKSKSSKPKRTRLVKSDKYYINNKDFSNEIIMCKEKGELSPRAIEFFIILANRTVRTKKLHHRNQEDGDL